MIAAALAWPLAASAAPVRDAYQPSLADWETKPSGEAVSATFPPLAAALGLEGSAKLRCSVDRMGLLHDCKVIELAAPSGFGFEGAALSLTPMFRMRPNRTSSGQARSDTVQIPLAFRLPSPTKTFPDPPPPLSPDGLALARIQVAQLPTDADLDQAFERMNNAFLATPGVEEPVRKEAVATLREAQARVHAELREFLARVVAANLTTAQIQRTLDFGATPGAQAMRKGANEIQRRANAFISQHLLQFAYGLHEGFCRAHGCDARPPPNSEPAVIPWIEQPTPRQFEAASPKLALPLLIEGFADLSCGSTDSGVLVDCQVVREKPEGLGFGDGALSLAGFYRRPPAIRGEITELRVRFPSVSIPKIDIPARTPRGGPRDALALEVVKAEGYSRIVAKQGGRWAQEIQTMDLPGVPDATRTQAAEVFQSEFKALADQLAPIQAEAYADLLTEAQLKERLAYVSGPDYAATEAANDKAEAQYKELGQAIASRVAQEGRRLYCLKHHCPKLLTPEKPRSVLHSNQFVPRP